MEIHRSMTTRRTVPRPRTCFVGRRAGARDREAACCKVTVERSSPPGHDDSVQNYVCGELQIKCLCVSWRTRGPEVHVWGALLLGCEDTRDGRRLGESMREVGSLHGLLALRGRMKDAVRVKRLEHLDENIALCLKLAQGIFHHLSLLCKLSGAHRSDRPSLHVTALQGVTFEKKKIKKSRWKWQVAYGKWGHFREVDVAAYQSLNLNNIMLLCRASML